MKTIIPFATALVLAFGASQALHADGLQQTAGTQKSFEEVDADGDGAITKEEADSAGVSINWDEADPDGDGSLTRDEYMSAVEMESGSEPAEGAGSSM